jgi:tricorn protease
VASLRRTASLLVLLTFPGAGIARAAEPPRLLQHPTASKTTVVFEFAGDLWSVPRSGGAAARLTSGPATESAPWFSPDGQWVAFTGEYEGNGDVYVIPAAGGVPRRLTWHPGLDVVAGWTPDGRVLFSSGRSSAVPYPRLFTIGLDGGLPAPIELPGADAGSFSPDGRRLAYVPYQQWQAAWKRYRGGQTTPIWVADLSDGAVTKVPRENSNDGWPMFVGSRVYFVSDREGASTLYAYDTASGQVTRALAPGTLDIKSATAGPGGIAYARPGEIRVFDPATGADAAVPVTIAADLIDVRPRWVKAADAISSHAISPGGVRAAFEARGDIFTVPADKGDVRNLTRTPGVMERDPSWSPDGQRVAYFSDASGEYALHIAPQSGLGTVKVIPLGEPPSFFYAPRWSPDSKLVAFHDKRLTLWYVNADGGAPVKIDQDHYETPERSLDPQWSPDSRWLVYTRQLPSYLHAAFAYELAAKKVVQLTDGLSDVRYPVFDRGGKLLFFTATTNLGLGASWLDMSSYEKPIQRAVYVAVLEKAGPSPLAPESDEEKPEEQAKDKKDDKKDDKDAPEKAEPPPPVTIDADRISQRILALPIPARNYTGLQAGKAGELFLLEGPQVFAVEADPATFTLHRFDLTKRKTDKLVDGIASFLVASRGEKLLYKKGDGWFISGSSEVKAGEGALKLDDVQLLVDPVAEWRQMFREAWRIQRDFMYDAGHHGLDLSRAAARYAPFLDGLASRRDLTALFEEMLGETTLGHTFVFGGDTPKPPAVKGGLLGADLTVENGRYRVTRVYDGESWNPKLRAPLTQPGVNVVAGEYVLAVDGRDLAPPDSIYRALANTAGRQVVLRVGPSPTGAGARDVTVVPIESETPLRNRAWVEDNRRTVDRLSGGRLAYVYLPNTADQGYTYFNRYLFSQVGREGVVVDERFNGGGSLADYIVDYLGRAPRSRMMTREGADQGSPGAAIFGPKVMIINEMAGSGGDALPWYFRKAGLGKLVGRRTWGGLVGIYDYPPLIDGGQVTAPRVAIYDLNGQWTVENAGIAPDVEVDLEPKAWRQGRDSQLEAAVAIAMEELKKSPRPAYPRPSMPDYHKGTPLGRQ